MATLVRRLDQMGRLPVVVYRPMKMKTDLSDVSRIQCFTRRPSLNEKKKFLKEKKKKKRSRKLQEKLGDRSEWSDLCK